MKTGYLLLLFLLYFTNVTHAIHFKHLGPENGLAHPTVLSIFQDSIGRIWLGTTEGLSVYDGNQLTSYKPYQRNTLPLFSGEVIKRITSTSGNDLFFITNKALVKYNIREESFNTIWEKSRIHSIFSYRKIIWVAVSHELYQWDDRNQKLTLHTRLPFEISEDLLIDRKGRKWFATSKGIFRTVNDIDFERITDVPDIVSVFESANGEIWAGSRSNGLLRILPNGQLLQYNTYNSSSRGLYSNNVRKIAEDSSGNIWFGTFNGLYKFNPSTDMFVSYTRQDRVDGISNSSVYPVFINNEDILWAGTYFGGVNYASVRGDSFIFYNSSDRENYLSNPVVGSMTEDNNGNIWICTEGGGLNMLQPASGYIKHFTSPEPPFYLPHTNLKSILYDADERLLYIGTNARGLYTYDIRRNKFNQEITANDSINTIDAIARDGDRLFLSSKRRIYVYSLKERKLSLLYQSSAIASAHIRIGADRHLWVVEGYKVLLFDIETLQLARQYDLSEQGIYSRVIRTFQSTTGNIYICTYGNGIMKLDTTCQQFEPYPSQASPVPSSYCYQIDETPNGNLIVTGDKGITLINEKKGVQKSLLLEEYFPLNAFMRDCGLFVSKNGTIYAGGINGMVSFSEAELSAPTFHGQLYFTKMYVHENLIRPNDASGILTESLPFTRKITLAHNQSKIELQFTSKAYASVLTPQIYEYKLHGMDQTWYQTTHKSISYTHLPPGDYILEIREKIFPTDETMSQQLRITILPPWYVTWWAWMIWTCLFLLLTSIVVYIWIARRRMRDSILKEQMEKLQIKKIDEAKFRFFTSVSHEFRTPLTLIIGQLELLLQSHKVTSSVYNKLTKVIRQAQHLSNLVTELIEFRKYEQEQMTIKVTSHSINHYVSQIYDNFKELALRQEIKYLLQLCEEDVDVWFDGSQMLKVLYNLLSNAFKYTPQNGEISIHLSVDKKMNLLYIRVMDSGVGMNPDELNHVFDRFYQADNRVTNTHFADGAGIGLALARSIIEAHKGTIEVKSQTGYGSIFTITLLLGLEHLRNDKHVSFEESKNNTAISLPYGQYLPVEFGQEENDKEEAPVKEKIDIVIIEDNTELAEMLVNLFSPFYNVHTAINGKEGYALIREIRPALVISDVMMPVMTGTELCTKLKNDFELCHIPIVLLTALNMPEQTIEGLKRGADDYISKPFNTQVLLARCNNLIYSRNLLYKQFTQKPDAEIPVIATNKPDQEFMEKVISIIDKNIESEFNNDKIAVEMGMSRSSFYNKFKVLTGMSPNDFINSYKLKKAVVMLKEDSGLPISEIADRLGYSSVNYFCRKFKAQFGMSPSIFRKKDGEEMNKEEEEES